MNHKIVGGIIMFLGLVKLMIYLLTLTFFMFFLPAAIFVIGLYIYRSQDKEFIRNSACGLANIIILLGALTAILFFFLTAFASSSVNLHNHFLSFLTYFSAYAIPLAIMSIGFSFRRISGRHQDSNKTSGLAVIFLAFFNFIPNTYYLLKLDIEMTTSLTNSVLSYIFGLIFCPGTYCPDIITYTALVFAGLYMYRSRK